MRITFLLPCIGISGGIRVVFIYAQYLSQMGHQVLVVSIPQKPLNFKEKLMFLLKGKGIFSAKTNIPSYFDHIDVPHKVIDRYRPIIDFDLPDADIVIATWWETAEWAIKLSPKKGVKVYFIQHHEVFDYFSQEIQERARATYLLPFYPIVVSQWLADLMQNIYGIKKLSLVPNSIDTSLFFAPERGKMPIPTVGMYYAQPRWKGTDIVLKAISLAREKIPNLQIVAFGEMEPQSSGELHLLTGTSYTRLPAQEKLREIYGQCDVWIFGSRLEGFGLPILEAMACRTPVIGTPTGAAPELLADGTGILVKSEDPQDMANAIIRVYQMSEEEWKNMSQKAYDKAKSYSWDDATKLFERALNTAIENSI